jgi:hypothetical protein
MRNISFALTKPQILARTKTQTRRLRWLHAKPGMPLQGCEKCQGLKPGEQLAKLAVIRVVAVRRERLDAITQADVIAEGFPDMTPAEFVAMFTGHMRCEPGAVVTVIEFEYVDQVAEGDD